MSGLFYGLELGKRALMAQQLALNTSGHNVANAATPGYSRQRVSLTQTLPLDTPQGSIGSGVYAKDVRHVRDLFLGSQYRNDNGHFARWETTHKSLSQVELFFNEPSDKGLNQLIQDFWNSWENLATNPTARSTVVEKTKVLINAFHEHAQQLSDLRTSIDTDVKNRISEINLLSTQIASINRQIAGAEIGGGMANDLRDQRDLLIDKLSSMVQVRTLDRPNGTVAVLIGSMTLVDGGDDLKIETKTLEEAGATKTLAVWEGTNIEIDFTGGEIYANQQLRDKTIPEMQAQLDTLARTIIEQVNALHRTGIGAAGSTDVDFFDPTFVSAQTIALNPAVELDPNLIAASLSGEPGDTRNAQAISELRNARLLLANSVTINEYYANMVGTLGIKTQEAEVLKENYDLLVTQLDNARQSVQGVSVDEEVTDMIRFQRAYEAAARVITFMDGALETVISGMGVTR